MCISFMKICHKKYGKHFEDEEDQQKRLYYSILNFGGNLKSLEDLLATAMDVDFWDEEGNSFLHLVCDGRDNHRDCLRLVKSLVKYGVDPHAKNKQKVTCLMQAVARGKKDVTQFLITRCGVDVNARDCLGSTALCQAVRRELVEEVRLLLDANADPNLADHGGDTSLHHAVHSNNSAILNLLLAKADPNRKNGKGLTPLHLAIQQTQRGLNGTILRLIEGGAEVNIADQSGTTLLMKAALRGDVTLCQYLVQNGSYVNAVDEAGDTALHHAIRREHTETVKYLLIESGANTSIRNVEGEDCLRHAVIYCPENTTILKYIKEFGNNSKVDVIEGLELLGCHFILDRKETQAFRLWVTACELRDDPKRAFPKSDVSHPSYALAATEFRNKMELRSAFLESAGPLIQALLVYERILGPTRAQTLSALRHVLRERGFQISSSQGLDICELLLERTVSRYGLCCRQTLNSLEVIVFYLLQSQKTEKNIWGTLHRMQRIITDKLKSQVKVSCQNGLTNQTSTPVDGIANYLLAFIHISLGIGCSDEQLKQTKELVREILFYHPTNASGNGLLHLAVSGCKLMEEELNFDQKPTVELLLECGASVNCVNNRGATPLHLAAANNDLGNDILEAMIGSCTHTDSCDADRQRISTLLARRTEPIILNNLERLQCLAAQAIMNNRVPYNRPGVPIIIKQFISIH